MRARKRSMFHSLYIHIPFCRHRCAYCDFNTYAGKDVLLPAYVEALCVEIGQIGGGIRQDTEVGTIYFGGGTPSLLKPSQIARVLRTVETSFRLRRDAAEITMEANPGSLTRRWLAEARLEGVNRLSLGVQSANGEELRLLERQHSYQDVLDAVTRARSVGFRNINLDLIYGLPGQDLQSWKRTVERTLILKPEHVSAYALTMEHGTPLGQWSRRGLLASVDDDLAADMYEWVQDRMQSAGYTHYEISNWAMPGYECRHNLQYWRGGPYIGCGAGAHGYFEGHRYSNVLGIGPYINRLEGQAGKRAFGPLSAPTTSPARTGYCEADERWSWLLPAAATIHRQSRQDETSEFMFMGLRLTEDGLSEQSFADRFGKRLTEVWGSQVEELVSLGLLERWDPTNADRTAAGERVPVTSAAILRLTPRGRLLGNEVFQRFVE
jgi:oxygen-independent coproporphyrinogen-3 oxidase